MVLKYTQMRAHVEKVDVLGWNKCTVLFYYFTSEDNRHYVLDNLLSKICVLLDFESCLSRHTVFATIRRLIQFSFYHLTSGDSKHSVLSNLKS